MNMCILYTVYQDSGAEECKSNCWDPRETGQRTDTSPSISPLSLSLFSTHTLPFQRILHGSAPTVAFFLFSSLFLSLSNSHSLSLFCVIATHHRNHD